MDDAKILALLEQNKAMIGERDPILDSVHADLGRSTIDDDWQVRGVGAVQLKKCMYTIPRGNKQSSWTLPSRQGLYELAGLSKQAEDSRV
jgi:hypothetical protein